MKLFTTTAGRRTDDGRTPDHEYLSSFGSGELNQRTNGPVNAHLISGPTVSTKKKQILTSIKGRNSVANLRNTIIYNTNIDLVNDDVYTKFGLIL